MTSSERGKTTPCLTDFGWVFLRHADFPELASGEPSEETKRTANRITRDRWERGRATHGWTVMVP